MIIFAGVMLLAAGMMFRQQGGSLSEDLQMRAYWKVMLDGLGVGILTGIVGVGGGFLIVPALVLLGGPPMRLAIGTSLLIISARSATGFVKYVDVMGEAGLAFHWDLMLVFSLIGIAGTLWGASGAPTCRSLGSGAASRSFSYS